MGFLYTKIMKQLPMLDAIQVNAVQYILYHANPANFIDRRNFVFTSFARMELQQY